MTNKIINLKSKFFKHCNFEFKYCLGFRIFKLGFPRRSQGMYLPVILIASILFIAFASAIITLSMSNVKIANLHNKKITSMGIAEAGLNYYLWHLSHNNTDYCDGNPCSGSAPYGPFLHDYKDESGTSLGTFEIYVTPPQSNGSVTTVKSVGKVNGKSPVRTIISTIGMPSFAKYTLMINGKQLWVGPGEKIEGTVHVNGSGLYNQGEITGDASSTEKTYNGWFGSQPGVAGPGIFGGAKLYPVPPIDFNQINVDILNIRNATRDLGEGDYYDSSGSKGYHVVLKANQYELWRVTKYDNSGYNITQENLLGTHNYPDKGVIFVEDNLWVEGTIQNQKVTLVAADPEANGGQKKRIIIPNLVKYTNYDGSDKIGLITQTDILLTRNAPNNMEIDAAMIAKEGEIRIDPYKYEHKGNMKVYGSMAHTTGLVWTYDYGGGLWSGYHTTQTIIDTHNVLNPPPKFPLTGTYSILSWREE